MLQEEKHSGFLNEAKEWAGELLSGQTKVGGREIGKNSNNEQPMVNITMVVG